MTESFRIFRNTEPLWVRDIPQACIEDLVERTRLAISGGARFVAWFGQHSKPSNRVRVFSILAIDEKQQLAVQMAEVSPGSSYPSLTADVPAADRAERELFEQFGIRPEGHPWLKPVRHPVSAAVLAPGRTLGEVPENNIGLDYEFWKLAGDAVHEVGVGPIHAGVIGPGYFRFSCVGERIEHLEIMLGFEHRGAEDAVVKASSARRPVLVESIAGDTSAGYATAYAQAIESLSGTVVSDRADALRAFALETERLAYHVGDLGALAGDVAYAPSAAYFGRLRGEFLNTAMDLGGNRQGRYFVRPGGVRRDLPDPVRKRLVERFQNARRDLEGCLDQMFSSLSVVSRFENSACVSRDYAVAFGFVGMVARSCGVAIDVRADHPTGYWQRHPVTAVQGEFGSVLDRAMIRKQEIESSLAICQRLLENLPTGSAKALPQSEVANATRGDFCLSLVEGWRGQVALALILDETGKLERFKSQDPSFQNWNAMQIANRGNAISDFPVCNKSCNLAYNGHDL